MQAPSRNAETTADAALRPDAARASSLMEASWQDSTGLRNMQQLIQLRWIAVVGQVVTIFVVHFGLGIALPLPAMFVVLAGLVAFNLGSQLRWWRDGPVSNNALLLALIVDVASLALQLHLSGGIANPFVFLFLLQVALSTVLLRPPASWVVAMATVLCVVGLILVPAPVRLPVDPARGFADHYVQGLLICFALVVSLFVVFITRIARILRDRDARLAELRQRAAEEDHIVRIGLLASGAAHELGTPLSTLSVILGDWHHLPTFASDPELSQDVSEMQAQVMRCKSIVTNILLAAGETRGESPVETTLHDLFDDLADEWRTSRHVGHFHYRMKCTDNPWIVSDAGLRQMVFNVLDNAVEVSPDWVAFDIDCRDGALVIDVADAGPGFSPEVLQRLGAPYNSTKGRPGGGLGLFLSANVARTLGGRLSARNRPQGGAIVTMTLPMSAIAIEVHDHDD
ncbi:MAG TPA: ATP-binding protein [Xanthomonadaceae bacterium]